MATRPGDERMLRQLEQFAHVGHERKFFVGVNREELYRKLLAWIPAFRSAMNPAEVSASHRKILAPHLKVFDRSHELVTSLIHLFQGWGAATQKQTEVDAKIPRLVVGEDEEDDLERLRAWPAIFTQLFGTQGLPHALTAAELKKQFAAHEAAQAALPTTTAGQVYRATYATLKRLRTEGDEYFERMHDLLDGEFGRSEESFARKAEYGYDRKLRGGGQNRQRRKEEKKTAPGEDSKTLPGKDVKSAPGKDAPATPPVGAAPPPLPEPETRAG